MGTTTGLGLQMYTASTTYLRTGLPPLEDVVGYVGTKINLLLGGGLGLVDATIGWIMAIIVVTIILGLIYKGLRFFGILR